MAGINVGSVLVDVLPDARGWDARLQEQIRNISAKVKIDLDDAGMSVKLDAIKAKLAEIGAKSPSIKVDVDTAGAEAKLAAVGAEADRTSGKTSNLGNSASGASGGMSLLMKSALALSPALIPVAAAAAGVGAALASMAAAGAAGVGILSISIASVTNAVKLLGQQQAAQAAAGAAAAGQAAAHAQAIVSAERQIQSAEMSLGDARRQAATSAITAAQQVQSAQYGLIQADQQEQNALQALQAARESATRQLTSMANSAVDARLAERQAVLDLQTAIANNNATQASSTATAQQKAQAALDLQKAQQHLTEAQQANTYAAQDNAKAQKLGVDGSPQVVSAAQNVATAQHNQAQAAQTLANAQRNAADQQIQSAEAIKRAQQSVAAAMDQMAAAQRNAADSSNTALAKVNAQVAALDPVVRSFAEYLRGTWAPIWKGVQSAANGGLLPGVREALDAVRPLMPQFTAFIGGLAQRLGDLAAAVGRSLGSPFWQQFFGFVGRTAGPALSALGQILGNLAKGFAGLLMAFQPIIGPIISGIASLAQKFADFGTQASSSAGFGKFVAYVKASLPLVGDTVKNIFKAVIEAVSALAPVGTAILLLLDRVAKFLANTLIPFLRPIVAFIATQLAPVFGRILGAAIDGARAAFGFIMKAINDHRPELEQLWSFIKNYLAPVIGFVLKMAFELVGDAIMFVITIISKMIDAWNWLWGIGKGIGHWFANDFVGFFVGAWRTISSGWDGLVKGIAKLWGNLKHYLMDPVAFVVRYVIDDGLIKAWDWVVSTLHLPGSWHANPMAVPAVPPLMAHGGVIPGYAPGVDSVHAILSPGEGVLVPEAVRGLGGPAAIHAINSQFNTRAGGPRMSGGLAHFDGGGFWAGVGNALTDLIPGMAGAKAVSPQINAIMSDPLHAFPDMIKALMGGLSSAAPMVGLLGDMVGSLAKGVGQAVWNAIAGSAPAGGQAQGGVTNTPSSQAANVAAVRAVASTYGWGSGYEWDNLVKVINRESGFNNVAQNPTSTAYGMFQFLDSTWGGYGIGKTSDAHLQAVAGLKYIASRYGDPFHAWAHEVTAGWYDNGGIVPPGPSLVYNGTGGGEHMGILTDAQWRTMQAMASGRSGGSAGPVNINARVFVGNREITDIARVEAESVMTAAWDAHTNRATFNS